MTRLFRHALQALVPLLGRAARAPWAVLAFFCLSTPMAHAIEEPAYEVERRIGDVELRRYAPYVVAEVTVSGPAESAGNAAFPILAGYIFGKNKGERRMAMTAPVTQASTPVKMAMTAPVTQFAQAPAPGASAAPGAAASADSHVVQFVLPANVRLDTAPEPVDARVRLRQVEAHRLAAIRYSGRWTQANYDEQLARLQATLGEAGVAWTGEPVLARYNAPMTPPFMRRNEVWLALP